jgi:hypothetical protein
MSFEHKTLNEWNVHRWEDNIKVDDSKIVWEVGSGFISLKMGLVICFSEQQNEIFCSIKYRKSLE